MKAGDYVRTDTLGIWKLEFVRTQAKKYTHHLIKQYNDFTIFRDVEEKRIVKSSPNIIDLIEVGDYVNRHLVFDKAPNCVYIEDNQNKMAHIPYTKDNIESVLTKEQFESMEYKIGE